MPKLGVCRTLRHLLWVGMVTCLSVGAGAEAQSDALPVGPLTADGCVVIALARNDLVAQAEAGVQSSKGAYWQSLREVLPTISGSARWSGSHQEQSGVVSGQYQPWRDQYGVSLGVSASQSLINIPGITSVRRGRSQLEAAHGDFEATRDEIEVTARQQFFTLLAAIKLADVEQRAVALAGEQLRRAETLFRLGSVARSDVLQAQVNLAEAEQIAMNRGNAVELETGRLAMVMGLDPRTPIVVDSTLGIPDEELSGPLDEWVQRAYVQRPDLAAAAHRLRAAELAVTAAKFARLPTISGSWSYGRSGSSVQEWTVDDPMASWQNAWSLGVRADLTLFAGMSIQGRIESAVGERRQQRARLERLEKEVALEVRDAYLSAANESENVRAADASLALNRENLRLQQALYESGAGTLLEWDNARLDLRRAEVSLIQAQINLLLAHVRFRKAVGA